MDHARGRLVAAQDADAHAPRGKAGDERRRPVDGVEDDPVGPGAATHGSFLSKDSRLGQARAELAHEERLDLAVGGGDQRPVRLALARNVLEMAESERPGVGRDRLELGAWRQLHGERMIARPSRNGHHASSRRSTARFRRSSRWSSGSAVFGVSRHIGR